MFASSEPYNKQQNRSIRLIFAYRGSQVELNSQQRVAMLAPDSASVEEYEEQSGFWVELRDAEGSVLYRQVMHNPIQLEYEAPSGDPERPFTRVKNETSEGIFAVVVPDIAEANLLALHSSPAEDPTAPAKEIARIELRPSDSKPNR